MSEISKTIGMTGNISDAETGADENIATETKEIRVDLKEPEYTERFQTAEFYIKKKVVSAVQVTETGLEAGDYKDLDVEFDEATGQYVITTWVMRGEGADRRAEVEDKRRVEPGEWIVTNPLQQEGDRANNYPVPDETFKKRYEATDQAGQFRAKGKARIIKNPTGKKVVIEAPWGGEQTGDEECYFCAVCDDETLETISKDNRYILSANDFATYEVVEGAAETPEQENEKFGEALISRAEDAKEDQEAADGLDPRVESLAIPLARDYAEKNYPKQEDGRFKPAWRGVNGEKAFKNKSPEDLVREGMSIEEAQKSVIDIANLPYNEYSDYWKEQNRGGAEFLIQLLEEYGEEEILKQDFVNDREARQKFGHLVHENWLSRNEWVKDPQYGDPNLAKPFAELDPVEQQKDIDQLIILQKWIMEQKKPSEQ